MRFSAITSEKELRRAFGEATKFAKMFAIDHLDRHCKTLLQHSPFGFLAYEGTDGRVHSLATGGAVGYAKASSQRTLELALGDAESAQLRTTPPAPGSAIGTLFFNPGRGETLRINGRLRSFPDIGHGGNLSIDVHESLLHCAKAFLRSNFWHRGPNPGRKDRERFASSTLELSTLDHPAVARFLPHARMALVSSVRPGAAGDVSPKGEPGPVACMLDPMTLAIPERPGNRRLDTFRNLLVQPRVALDLLIPNASTVMSIRGTASISADPRLQKRFAFRAKDALGALVVTVEWLQLRESAVFTAANMWSEDVQRMSAGLPTMGQVVSDHIKLHKDRSLKGRLIKRLTNARNVDHETAKDYRKNLY